MDESLAPRKVPLWRAPRQHLAWAAILFALTLAIASGEDGTAEPSIHLQAVAALVDAWRKEHKALPSSLIQFDLPDEWMARIQLRAEPGGDFALVDAGDDGVFDGADYRDDLWWPPTRQPWSWHLAWWHYRASVVVGSIAGLLAALLWLRYRQAQSPSFPPLATIPSPKELGGMLLFAAPIWFVLASALAPGLH